jgi:hypothetical protein
MNFRRAALPVLALLTLAAAVPASADLPASPDYAPAATSFAPQVPVSAFAQPSGWLDMSRLRVSTSVSFGTGFGGTSTGLQVTSLSYQLAQPLAVRVSVGNTFGSANMRGGNSLFLEGFAVQYRPHPAFQINVDYRDIRSPLQYQQYYSPFGYYGPFGP